MIKLTSTSMSNRTSNRYLCRHGCIVGVDILIKLALEEEIVHFLCSPFLLPCKLNDKLDSYELAELACWRRP
jgi:hypothetical protein